MPMPQKPTPVKHCEYCGKQLERPRSKGGELMSRWQFERRKFCNIKCMARAFDERPQKSHSWSQMHYHARKMVPKGSCQRCGKPLALDTHHTDGSYLNNSPDNLERICRSCHMKAHRAKGTCKVCGLPQKGLGYCEKHYQRFKKWGDPHAFKRNQHTPLQSVD